MKYSPSSETLDVLRQAGYGDKTISEAISEFTNILIAYPDLIKPTDREFYSHLKTKNIKKSIEISKNFDSGTAWRPGIEEMNKLDAEGYWEEIVHDLLGDFLFRPPRYDLVISRFGLFRAFLRDRYPLLAYDISEWTPDPYLLNLIKLHLFIHEPELDKLLPHFRRSATTKQVPGTRIPRYFFKYVKHNKEKLRGTVVQERSLAYPA